jgi:hypothetical protein
MAELTSCESSLAAHEPVFATATEAQNWICLEHRGPWAAKAFKASDLPSDVKGPLAEALDSAPNSRLQFIRKPGRTRGSLALFVVRASHPHAEAFRLDFTDYRDLASLDFGALVAGVPPAGAARVEMPLILVCGNGRRDACCARHGTAVYRSLAQREDADVWLSNHQGGHRFAANVVLLPHGIQFGRMRPDTAPDVIGRCLQGTWDLEHTRGRVAYPRPAQAAEHVLRQRTGELGRDAFRLHAADPLGHDRWHVTLEETAGGRRHSLEVTITPSSFEVIKTTGDAEPANVPQYSVELS